MLGGNICKHRLLNLSRGNSLIALTAPWKIHTKRTIFTAIESLPNKILSKLQTLVYRRIKIIGRVYLKLLRCIRLIEMF